MNNEKECREAYERHFQTFVQLDDPCWIDWQAAWSAAPKEQQEQPADECSRCGGEGVIYDDTSTMVPCITCQDVDDDAQQEQPAQHDNLRDRIGQAISDAIGDEPEGIDWFDSREIDRLADAVLSVVDAQQEQPSCEHSYHYFGDQVTQRRCVRCDRLEPFDAQQEQPCEHKRTATSMIGAMTNTGWKCADCGKPTSAQQEQPAPKELPPLPRCGLYGEKWARGYTQEQMREYALAAVDAQQEQPAAERPQFTRSKYFNRADYDAEMAGRDAQQGEL